MLVSSAGTGSAKRSVTANGSKETKKGTHTSVTGSFGTVWNTNPFSPKNDPLSNLYPNSKAGLTNNSLGIGATQTSSAKKASSSKSTGSSSSSSGSSYSGSSYSGSSYSGSSSSGSGNSATDPSWDYINADLAKQYKMDQTTAYQEALSNTQYQRTIKDMMAAGLNPRVLFAQGSQYVDGGVGYASPMETAQGFVAGSGGYSGRSSYRYSRSSGKLFSKDSYAGIAGIGTAIGAIVGAVSSKRISGVAAGASAGAAIATGVAKVANAISKLWKK